MLQVSSAPLDVGKIKHDFPILTRKVHKTKKLVYLDNAATTQKPVQVIDSISDYYCQYNSNIHRSVHELAEEATEKFESTRDKIAAHINARSREEIVFTKNSTEALNLVAYSLTDYLDIQREDKIVLTELEHHSNFVPWQYMCKKRNATLEIVDVNLDGEIDEDDLERKLKGAKIFAFSHMSNVLGTISDAKKLTKQAHSEGCKVVVDGAQSAPHLPINIQDIGCDFFVFSAHKMLGPTGVGCLYGKRELLETIPPFLMGGDMIREVHREDTKWNEIPWKFEAGTSNIADVIGFGSAIDYLNSIGMYRVKDHESKISRVALEELSKLDSLRIYGPMDYRERGAVISFNLGKIHAHDIASLLDLEGIAIRSGHHCAQPLMEKLNVPATSRASFYIYNDMEDVQALISGLKKVEQTLG